MDKPEFDAYFAVLDKASDRARSVVYVFIIVYLAVLLYAINAFAYPARQFTYDAVNLQVACQSKANAANTACAPFRAPPPDADAAPSLDAPMQTEMAKHELQLFWDDSVAVRTFKFPVFGLETDRDALWFIFPIMGLIAYQIVWLVLEALAVMFRFLLDRNRRDPARIRLLQSVLVITTPLNTRRHDVTALHQLAWQAVTALVFAIPILVSVLAIADLTNAIPALILKPQTERLMPNLTQGTLGKLAFELAMTLVQVWLYGKLYALVQRIGSSQSEASSAILDLEGGSREAGPRRAEPLIAATPASA